ncbi:preprotein translocase subunit YajC [uncultured Anaerococcus sp.]|uniref:preprotein translocase subunit YajC n=1 Tax=uncultured Anaerococcus sp. TaxID=293428 RepID=UPI00260859A9|nr:preprotein translocase subunit YajC [uncultured Anaerococcus sp.]
MKLEYIILIVLCIGFYEKSIKDDLKIRKNREFVNDNIDIGSNIVTNSGIIGEVTHIEGDIITILSGEEDSISKLKIQKSEIKNIIS